MSKSDLPKGKMTSLTIPNMERRRQRQRERQKSNIFRLAKHNFARTVHFLAHFFLPSDDERVTVA